MLPGIRSLAVAIYLEIHWVYNHIHMMTDALNCLHGASVCDDSEFACVLVTNQTKSFLP